jgi:hypothetical protein
MRDRLQEYDPEVFDAILGEERRQQTELELIPSENYTYPEVLAALGTVFTNKYSEGYPGTTEGKPTPTPSSGWPAPAPESSSVPSTPMCRHSPARR